MYAVISPVEIQLPVGCVVRLLGTWQDYCSLRDSRGDRALPRIKYSEGEILLMSPLPKHGREAHLLARVVEVLLDSKNRNYEVFTPITIELPEQGGIEPDYCFYLDNWQAIVGQERIDWRNSPPPDLVVEVDVTSYTAVEDYLPYKVPEVWLYREKGLQIYTLERDNYQQQSLSRYFPDLELSGLVEQVFQLASTQGTGQAIRDLRRRLRV
ncbi:MAG: Uma2 family endonuclease [Jaaginema sp. PMC 1079.18]|nr:Uma2 family endonuclease [Jaaginema sp. PMC 1080.18]MEC4853987.1 Uma2 family endonuclease [Jaaginema sp. PMC 1079.18]MEC4867059.1 Uma2 family endonuclease [Jaaginema sp. PMC 1078.18]